MAELKQLGRYELRRVLGRGAMGVVYEGFDPSLGRQVAIKTILKNATVDLETERAYSARFTLEAKAVARLNHQNIVQVYDFGVESDVAYLVMEFIQGRELRSYFDANQKFDQAETVRVMGELLDALHFAHEAGVIHRDVKPANVMLDAQGRVKLADFGVARIQDSDKSAAGTMVGTPAFMSPEQIQGQKIDRRTDLFSAGVVLYQLLTGEQPFRGAGAWTVAKKIMQDDPPQPSSLVSNVSPAFDAVVDRALAKSPADRFPNASAFAAALRGALDGVTPLPMPSQPGSQQPRSRSASRASDTELEFWRTIQNSSVPAEFEAYLQQFPEGTYAGLAKVKRDSLQGTLAPRRDDATVAILEPREPRRRSLAVPAGIAAVVLALVVGAYLVLNRTPPVAEPQKVELSAADIEQIRREVVERIQRDFADKTVAEQVAAAKAATEKALQEKQAALQAAADKAAADKAAAEKTAAEKAAQEKSNAEKAAQEKSAAAEKAVAGKAAAEKAAAEKIAADKAAVEKIAAEKQAAEKAAADKLAAEKASAAKAAAATRPGWPAVGDRWVYEAREATRPEKRNSIAVEVLSVSASSIRDVSRSDADLVETTHQAAPALIGTKLGVASFSPYHRAFHEIRGGESWSNVLITDMGDCTAGSFICNASARVVGKEKVAVRAGSFDTWKIVVDMHIIGTLRGTGTYEFWYAEDAKRVVKFRSRIRYSSPTAPWTQPDMDMELVSHTPAK